MIHTQYDGGWMNDSKKNNRFAEEHQVEFY